MLSSQDYKEFVFSKRRLSHGKLLSTMKIYRPTRRTLQILTFKFIEFQIQNYLLISRINQLISIFSDQMLNIKTLVRLTPQLNTQKLQ